jgi:hypothetical protein
MRTFPAALCLLALTGCASTLPPAPPAPVMQRNHAPPPIRPVMAHEAPTVDPHARIRITIGAGTDTLPPQQITLALAKRENINKVLWPNPDMLTVTHGLVGTPREGHHVVVLKALSDVVPTTHDVSIFTNLRQIDATVNVVSGRVKKTAYSLPGPQRPSPAQHARSECIDTLFSWQRTVYWAPEAVCVTISAAGTYQTLIRPPSNMQGSVTIQAIRDFGNGNTSMAAVNYHRREDGAFIVNDIWPLLRMNGDQGHVDIARAARS